MIPCYVSELLGWEGRTGVDRAEAVPAGSLALHFYHDYIEVKLVYNQTVKSSSLLIRNRMLCTYKDLSIVFFLTSYSVLIMIISIS